MSTEDLPPRRDGGIGFDRRAVVYRDFDVDLDEPGERSGAALDALLADLGVTAPGPEHEGVFLGDWASRLHAALTAGPPELLNQLDHEDMSIRRILAVVLAYLIAPAEIVAPGFRARGEVKPDDAARLGLCVPESFRQGPPGAAGGAGPAQVGPDDRALVRPWASRVGHGPGELRSGTLSQ